MYNLLYIVAGLVFAYGVLRFAFAPPSLADRTVSRAFTQTADTLLGKAFAGQQGQFPGLTGVYSLSRGREAFAARRRLVQEAERSIDAQYYMWHADLTGRLLLRDILSAADRGVRVRLLIDDNTTAGTDGLLAAVNAHPLVEIRLFNPFMLRKIRLLNLLFDFRRLNRRMHNKSFTVDNQASIVGGRNIGDEYFSVAQGMQFADMDVLLAGAVVADLSKDFDRYWASNSAFPAEQIIGKPTAADLSALRSTLDELAASEIGLHFKELADDVPIAALPLEAPASLEWVKAELFSDDPSKGVGEIPRKKLLVTGLSRALGETQRSLDVATAYFVPGKFGVGYLSRICKAGRTVRVLTNSLASNDVIPVHAGYARYRKKLLRCGVSIFELKPGVAEQIAKATGRKARLRAKFGASSSSLHAKIFVIDSARVFIGSFNFDPRSLYLNCEMGILIESAKLGGIIAEDFDRIVERQSYAPVLSHGHRLRWADKAAAAGAALIDREPESTLKQRVMVWLISFLPVEWLL